MLSVIVVSTTPLFVFLKKRPCAFECLCISLKLVWRSYWICLPVCSCSFFWFACFCSPLRICRRGTHNAERLSRKRRSTLLHVWPCSKRTDTMEVSTIFGRFCHRVRTQFYRDDRVASVARVVFEGRKRVVWNIFGTTETTHTTETTTWKPRLQLLSSFALSTRVMNIFMKSFYLVWHFFF